MEGPRFKPWLVHNDNQRLREFSEPLIFVSGTQCGNIEAQFRYHFPQLRVIL